METHKVFKWSKITDGLTRDDGVPRTFGVREGAGVTGGTEHLSTGSIASEDRSSEVYEISLAESLSGEMRRTRRRLHSEPGCLRMLFGVFCGVLSKFYSKKLAIHTKAK